MCSEFPTTNTKEKESLELLEKFHIKEVLSEVLG